MTRVRILRRASPDAPYEFEKTLFLPTDDVKEIGRQLVANHGMRVDDLVYVSDWYLQCTSIDQGEVTWRQVPAGAPEVRGLYKKIVEAETPVGDPYR